MDNPHEMLQQPLPTQPPPVATISISDSLVQLAPDPDLGRTIFAFLVGRIMSQHLIPKTVVQCALNQAWTP